MSIYKFKTSRGDIFIEFEEDNFSDDQNQFFGKSIKEYKITSSKEEQNQICGDVWAGHRGEGIPSLYDGDFGEIIKYNNGEYWIEIYLSDGAYGSPEYLLTKVE